MNQADAHFAGWHDSPVLKIRRIWCDTKSCTDKPNYGLRFELVRKGGWAASNLGKICEESLIQ